MSTTTENPQTAATNLDLLAINTIRTLAMDARAEGQQRASRHADGPGPGGLHAVAKRSALRSGRSRCGRAAIGSCSRAAMRRCCCIRCCTWPASQQLDHDGKPTGELAVRSRRSRNFANWAAAARASRSSSKPPASKPPPARWARAAATAWAWRSPSSWLAAHFNKPGFELFDYNVLRAVQRRRLDGRHLQRSRLDRRPSEALEPVLDLRRQPHHDRRRHRAGLQRRRGHAVRGLGLERRSTCPMPTTSKR